MAQRRRTSSPTQLGRYIRKLRAERQWTQWDLADRVGLRQTDISAIERGAVREPDLQTLAALAEALGESYETLLELTARRRYHVVRVASDVAVPVYGYIPADSVRIAAPLDDLPAVDVPAVRLEGAQDPYGLIVRGDCLRSIGIVSGDVVILDRPNGRRPRAGQVVAVRLGDEVTLKRWMMTDDGLVELRDGDDRVVATLDGRDSAEVVGLYVWHLPDATRGQG